MCRVGRANHESWTVPIRLLCRRVIQSQDGIRVHLIDDHYVCSVTFTRPYTQIAAGSKGVDANWILVVFGRTLVGRSDESAIGWSEKDGTVLASREPYVGV